MAECIFISYRREDASGHAGRLHDSLVARFDAEQVFMDLNMEPGVDFVDQLEEAVGSCAVLLVIMGRSWLGQRDAAGARRLDSDGDYVRSEVASALARGIRVVPVLVGGAAMPSPEELPLDLRTLARRNAIELSDGRWTHDVERLERVLERIIAGEPALEPARGAAAPASGSGSKPAPPGRRLRVLVAGLAVTAGALAAVVASGSEPQQSDAHRTPATSPSKTVTSKRGKRVARRAAVAPANRGRQVAPPPIVHPRVTSTATAPPETTPSETTPPQTTTDPVTLEPVSPSPTDPDVTP